MKKTIFGIGTMLSGAIVLAGIVIKRGLGDYYSYSRVEDAFMIMIGVGFMLALTAAYDIDYKALFDKANAFFKNKKSAKIKGENKNETN